MHAAAASALPSPHDASVQGDRGLDARFCGKGMTALTEGGCFAGSPSADAPLLIYLHGLHDDSTLGEELARQTRVAELAVRHRGRFATLAFHGRKGGCPDEARKEMYCWPSNERTAESAGSVVASFAGAIASAEARGARGRRYLLGFSNGGYFAMLVAQRGLLRLDGVAVAHAGPVPPTKKPQPTPHLLLLTADEDTSMDEMLRLSRELTAANWPFAISSRDGGHFLADGDVMLALELFERSGREPMPLDPPLVTRAPQPKRPMSEAGQAEQEATEPATELPSPPATEDTANLGREPAVEP